MGYINSQHLRWTKGTPAPVTRYFLFTFADNNLSTEPVLIYRYYNPLSLNQKRQVLKL